MALDYDQFVQMLHDENKDDLVRAVLDVLEREEVPIPELYEKYFLPAVNGFECPVLDRRKCVWMQKVQSSIIRTLLECTYPYLLRARPSLPAPKTVAVICPDGESDEIFARMISDYFTLLGHKSVFVGADTDPEDFVSVVGYIHPDLLVMNVVNPYHIVSASHTIRRVREENSGSVSVYVCGPAFVLNPEAVVPSGADGFITGYEDVIEIDKGGWSK